MAEPFQPSRHDRPVLVADWRDAEELAAWHMREVLGFDDVSLTDSGADGGVDVRSSQADAQVKHLAGPVGGPDIQRLRGATHGGSAIFYSRAGYTRAAIAAADTSQVGLFTYTVYGDVTPENGYARGLLQVAENGGYWEPEQHDRFVPLSARIRDAGRLTKAQAHDLEVFIVAQLAEVMLVEIELPNSCYPPHRWDRQPGDDEVLPQWQSFYQDILDVAGDLRGEYLDVVKELPTAGEWLGFLEGWCQRIQTARLREAILEDADSFTTTEELEEEFEARFEPNAGAQLVSYMWDDRRPSNLSQGLAESALLVPAHLLLDDDLWGERWGDISWTDLGVDPENPGARSLTNGSITVEDFFSDLRRARSIFVCPPLDLPVADVADLLDEAIESKRYRSGAARVAV